MKTIAIVIGFVVFLLGLIVGVYGFATGNGPNPSVTLPSTTPSPTPFAHLTGKSGKSPTDCTTIAEGEFKDEFAYYQTGNVPTFFPPPPEKSWICGYVPSRKSVYYISSLEDKILLDYYRRELEQKKCSSTGVQPAPPDRSYAFSLPFTCEQGSGVVATLATMSAFIVNYYDR